jgi:protein tyrosine/serine phosphatase
MFLTEVITPMGLEGFTKLFVMYAKDEIGCALRICSDPRNYPILIHCTSGTRTA